MKVSVIGTGYVGLVSGTCFAEIGHHVICIDIDEEKIKKLKNGECPIYEPGLTDLLKRNIKSRRLEFSMDYSSIKNSEIIFLGVQTPSTDEGRADLKYLESAAVSVAKNLSENSIIVIKSTVPVGTSIKIKEVIEKNTDKPFHIVNNPEFLKEGSAVDDFMKPDRVIIGHNDDYAADKMEELYYPLVRQGNPIYKMSNLSAEMSKYASNCLLATKISFINEIAKLCDLTGADIEEVRKGIMSDKRIGPHFLYPGPGYGGSCFPKDVNALVYTAKEYGLELKVIKAVEDVNMTQKTYMFEKIKKHFNGDLSGKTFAFWGVAFKPNTDDIREAPSIEMARVLVSNGATVNIFDPEASINFMKVVENDSELNGKVRNFEDEYKALSDCDGLVLLTEWSEFKSPNFKVIKSKLRCPIIFDARNIYEYKKIKGYGLEYYGIGKYLPKS